MLKTEKERIVSELAAELGSADTLLVADYRGLTNKQLEALRDQLLEHGARFRIVKNTLTRRAAEQAGAKELLELLEGPTAIAFVESAGDPAGVAKALATTARATNVLTLRGGVLEGRALSGAEVTELATLPPMDVLRGQVVGAIVAPVTQLVALLWAPLQSLHGLIEARITQLEEQGDTSVSAAEAAKTEDAPPEPAAPAAETETDDGPDDGTAAEAEVTTDTPAGSAAAERTAIDAPADPDETEPVREETTTEETADEAEEEEES